MTDTRTEHGWVLYDGDCRICNGFVTRFGPMLRRRGFACLPLQTPWVRERLNLSESDLMREMRVLDCAGNVIGGANAVLLLARTFWWAWPLVAFSFLPGGEKLLDTLYRWGAARRYCLNGACEIPRRRNWWLLLLPLGLPLILRDVAPWIVMWTMAASLWLALKVFTFMDVSDRPLGRSIAYFAWPGMDAPDFFHSRLGNGTDSSTHREWFFAILNITCGLGLLFAGARAAYAYSPLLAGWVAMVGMVLVLHFGTFKCLALLWRRFGMSATPIMQEPLRSRSLSEFWGRRWNTGFSIPARRYLMEPITRKFGNRWGVFIVFLISGLVHELVISVPAKAGYGLPTLYFLIQGFGLIGARTVVTNRLSALLFVAVPAFILFHPPFVHRVILPFLNAIGAI